MTVLEFQYRRENNLAKKTFVPKVTLAISSPNGKGMILRKTPTADTGASYITLNKLLAVKFQITLPNQLDGKITTGSGERVPYYLHEMVLELTDDRKQTLQWLGEVAFLEPQPDSDGNPRAVSTLFGRHHGLDLFSALFFHDGQSQKLHLTPGASFASYADRLG